MTNQERQLNQLKKLDPTRAKLVEAGQITAAEGLKQVMVTGHDPKVDLVITYRKYGRGSTSTQDAPILWWKVVGKEKESPKGKLTLEQLVATGRLDDYVLVGTEVQATQVVNRYVKKYRWDAPLRAARFARATHRSGLDPNEFYQETRTGAGTLSARWDGDRITEWKRFKAHPPEWAVRI